MKWTMRVIPLLVVALYFANPAGAQLRQGLGVFAGLTSTTYDVTDTDSGATVELGASGPAVAADFQVPLAQRISLNPFLWIASEDGDDLILTDGTNNFTASTEFELMVVGAQARFWATDEVFVGGHIANYDGELTLSVPAIGFTGTASESAVGFGLGAGYEAASGLAITVQYGVAGGDLDYSGLIALIGWRFGG